MKINILIISFFLLCYCTMAYAQKAYENVEYKATIGGKNASLTLADGYLSASKLVIHSKSGKQVYLPNSNEPDEKGNLQFNAVQGSGSKYNKGSWFIIPSRNKDEFPTQIRAIYWDGKVKKTIIFQ